MESKSRLADFTIVLSAKNHNPTILNPDFLKRNKIVPEDWALAEKPITVEMVSQVHFDNGIRIVAQLDKVIFSELAPDSRSPRIPEMVKTYVQTLPHVDYRAIGTNPRRVVGVESTEEAENFVLEKLITPGLWSRYGDTNPVASVKFSYTVDDARIFVSVDSASENETGNPILLFLVNVHRDILTEKPEERVPSINAAIEKWQLDVSRSKEIVDEVFLS